MNQFSWNVGTEIDFRTHVVLIKKKKKKSYLERDKLLLL